MIYFITSNPYSIMLALVGTQGSRAKPNGGTTPACFCTALLSPPLNHSNTAISQALPESWLKLSNTESSNHSKSFLSKTKRAEHHFLQLGQERRLKRASVVLFENLNLSPHRQHRLHACFFAINLLPLCQCTNYSIAYAAHHWMISR